MKKFLVFATVFAALPLAAQKADKKPMTQQQGAEILQELRQIRQLLEKQAKPASAPQEEAPTKAKIADLSGVPMLGSKSAPITIVEYTRSEERRGGKERR